MYIHIYSICIHEYIFTFVDVDECSDGTHNCFQTCTNSIGSYTCGCNTGFLLETNGITCSGMCKYIDVYSCM